MFRFDHSPCDPTINLKGCPSELFACAVCGQHFQTKEAWRKHLESKVDTPSWLCYLLWSFWEETCFKWCCFGYQVSSSTPDGHSMTQTYQCIVCFACPACYHFFNLRDECLQHMSAKNHFTESLDMTGKVYWTLFSMHLYWNLTNPISKFNGHRKWKYRLNSNVFSFIFAVDGIYWLTWLSFLGLLVLYEQHILWLLLFSF